MRILIRTSKWALWARRFGSLALPLAIVPVFMHREQAIDSTQFLATEAVALAVAVLALLLAIGAFVRLWISGDQGWGKAVWGLVFALICIAPAAYFGYEAYRYPKVNEVTTDEAAPLPLVLGIEPLPSDDALRGAIAAAFPGARSRTYPIDATQLYTLAVGMLDDRGWEIRARRAPSGSLGTGQLNAVAQTLLGWRDEVSIRIAGSAQGSRVDMASAPLDAVHDLGANGVRVQAFLVDLDSKITALLRNAPSAPVTADSDGDSDSSENPADEPRSD